MIRRLLLASLLAALATACSDPEALGVGDDDGRRPGGGGEGGGGAGGDGGSAAGGSGGDGGSAAGGEGGGVPVPCGGPCDPGFLCDELSDTCIPQAACEPACGVGFSCNDGACVADPGGLGYPCLLDADCAEGTTCALAATGPGFCSKACAMANECPLGTICLTDPLTLAGACAPELFDPCDGDGSCSGGDACTWYRLPGLTMAGCAAPLGLARGGVSCTTAADCATGLCSAPSADGASICTAPCIDDFSCSDLATTCALQPLTVGGVVSDLLACTAPAPGGLGTYGACCTSDADCDLTQSQGCRLAADGVTRACASGWTGCAALEFPDDDCTSLDPQGGIMRGNCLEDTCVTPTCW